jgi:photosystem II stability/assembly factor-like uncharacterized protein
MRTLSAVTLGTVFLASIGLAAPQWHALPGAPVVGRIDDLHFVDPDHGWAGTAEGRIYHTADGGTNWSLQLDDPSLYIRAIRFADTQNGWAGTLDSDELVYHTTNGGSTWDLVTNIPSPQPNAVCGMWVASSNVIYGVGSYSGPARLIKSSDGGATWTSSDLDPLATTLVDVYFPSESEGFAVGSIGNFPLQSRSVVLHTTDGGENWTQQYVGSRLGEWCWKISFATPLVGYVSLEKISSPMFVIKTVDGGMTWTELPFPNFNEQGIGFVSPLVGWVGGAENPTFGTTDGGATWVQTPWGEYLNRFQFLGPTLGYGGGITVYKYSESTVDVADAAAPPSLHLAAAPNPFEPRTTIRYSLTESRPVELLVADPSGRIVRTLRSETQPAGMHSVEWDGKNDEGLDVPAGFYLYVLHAGDQHEMGKLVRVR